MSWLARSLVNSLRLDEDITDGDDEEEDNLENYAVSDADADNPRSSTPRLDFWGTADLSSSQREQEAYTRGVKDDLSELGQTLTQQWRGVANFLVPPPDFNGGSTSNSSDSCMSRSTPSESGVQCDSPRIGNRVRGWDTELDLDYRRSRLEGNEGENPVSDLEDEEETEEEEEEEVDAVGVTDEVLAFARNIAMHPETWLDFPLDPEEDLDDFEMSDAQKEHAQAIEHLAPRLAALRIELCPCHMTVGYFWKVYFVLLHSRINKQDAEILSSPQVMEARALWMKELHKQIQPETDWFGRSISSLKPSEDSYTSTSSQYYAPPEFLSPRIYAFEPPSIMTHNYERVKHVSENSDAEFIDKVVIKEESIHKPEKELEKFGQSLKAQCLRYEDDDDWPEEEDFGYGGGIRDAMFTVNEEDVSFSDLEGDDDISSLALKSKMISKGAEQN